MAKIHHSFNPEMVQFGLPDTMSINNGILKREMKICYDEWNVQVALLSPSPLLSFQTQS
jgi:hypothetical protein